MAPRFHQLLRLLLGCPPAYARQRSRRPPPVPRPHQLPPRPSQRPCVRRHHSLKRGPPPPAPRTRRSCPRAPQRAQSTSPPVSGTRFRLTSRRRAALPARLPSSAWSGPTLRQQLLPGCHPRPPPPRRQRRARHRRHAHRRTRGHRSCCLCLAQPQPSSAVRVGGQPALNRRLLRRMQALSSGAVGHRAVRSRRCACWTSSTTGGARRRGAMQWRRCRCDSTRRCIIAPRRGLTRRGWHCSLSRASPRPPRQQRRPFRPYRRARLRLRTPVLHRSSPLPTPHHPRRRQRRRLPRQVRLFRARHRPRCSWLLQSQVAAQGRGVTRRR